jgi:hypothetical protein
MVTEAKDRVTIQQSNHTTTALMKFLQSTTVIEIKDLWVTVRVAMIAFNINKNTTMYRMLSTSMITISWTQVKYREYVKPHTALVKTYVRPHKLEIRIW